MAPDQRYCVECGQRRGPAQLPFLEQAAQRTREASTLGRQRRRPAMSVNTTLIAGIGTLMLAMGTGVLIGRSATSASGNTGGVQVLTVPSAGAAPSGGAGGTGAAGASTAGESESSAHTSEAGKSKAKAGKGAGSKSKATKSSASTKRSTSSNLPNPEKKVVTIGSKGKGPGYQKGEFTGHFFGEEGEEGEGGEGGEGEEAKGKGKKG